MTRTNAGLPHRIDRAMLDRLAARVVALDSRPALEVRSPFSGDVLGAVPHCTPSDVVEAAARARRAQPAWADTPVGERAAVLLRFHDRLVEHREQVLDVVQLEGGKARRHAFEEVLDTVNVARYYGNVAPRLLRPRRRQGAFPLLTSSWEHHPPRGLAGFIVPWNYPLTLGITDALPAVVAGNAALIKPDLQTPFSTLLAVEFLEASGLPPGLVQVVTGDGAELGPSLIGEVDSLTFTGSTKVGRLVARQAGERLIESSLELGGKNAMIVLDDADLDRAVPGAVNACFSNDGQLCLSIERLYVHDRVYDAFVPRFVRATQGLKLGPALDYSVDIGSLVSQKQLDAVVRHVSEATARGARVLAGGRMRPDVGPYFYEPTILEGVTREMAVCAEETFGPVVSLYRFASEEEAIVKANESPYGLSASIWTRNTRRGHRLATKIQAGTVNINEGYAAAWGSVDAPMGGFKDSGIGRRHGEQGLLKYTEPQTIAIQRLMPIAGTPFLSGNRYARALTFAMKMLKRVPGIK